MKNKRNGILEFDMFCCVARFSSASDSFEMALDGADASAAALAVARELTSRAVFPAVVVLPSSMLSISIDTIPAFSRRRAMKLLSNQLSGKYVDIGEYTTASLLASANGMSSSYVTYVAKRDAVENIRNIFKVKGKGTPIVTYAPLALVSTVLRSRSDADNSSFFVADIRRASTLLAMRMVGGAVLFDEIPICADDELIYRRACAFMDGVSRELHAPAPTKLLFTSKFDAKLCDSIAKSYDGAECATFPCVDLQIDKRFRF